MSEPTETIRVGLGFREPLGAGIFLHRESIDVVEITADHYIDAAPAKRDELLLLKEHFRILPHSLDLSLGSAEGLDHEYVEKLAELAGLLEPDWLSDHICFTRSGGVRIGHLAPIPYTQEALRVMKGNISEFTKRIATPLILENITYLMRFPSSEMTEPEFISRLVGETGCGLLLDVTNLYINSRNFGFDWRRFLDGIPCESVVQLHFTGLRRGKRFLIDAHSDPTQSEIWEVFREVVGRCPIRAAILERDDNFPPFSEIIEELDTAREICSGRQGRAHGAS